MAKLLIAEDEECLLNLFSRAVESLGHTVIRCSNGRLAWEVLCDNPDIQLLILDVVMPGMNGQELIARVHQDQRFAGMPILIVSGVIRAKDIAHLLEVGATCFMPKPVDIHELRDFVTKNLPALKEHAEAAHA